MKENKSYRIQLIIEYKLINELKEASIAKKINGNNESQLIRSAIIKYLEYENKVSITMYAMKNQIDAHKQKITELENQITKESIEKDRLIKDFSILENNYNVLKEAKNENRAIHRKKKRN